MGWDGGVRLELSVGVDWSWLELESLDGPFKGREGGVDRRYPLGKRKCMRFICSGLYRYVFVSDNILVKVQEDQTMSQSN